MALGLAAAARLALQKPNIVMLFVGACIVLLNVLLVAEGASSAAVQYRYPPSLSELLFVCHDTPCVPAPR
eukprot:SAG22_NODE_43_length_25304_cov_5.394644_12_plen_70_part_00